jgi:acyl carrier protein
MGLNLIEILTTIEDKFKIALSDEVAVTFTTPRKIIDYLMSCPEISEKCSRDYVENSVWQIIEEQLGIEREDFNFNEDSRFIEDMGIS